MRLLSPRFWSAVLVLAGTWVFLPYPSLNFTLPKIILCSTGIALFLLCKGLREDQIHLRQFFSNPLSRLLALYAAFIPLSLLWSIAPTQSLLGAAPRFEGVLVHLLYLVVTWIGIQMALSPTGRRKSTILIVVANAGVVLYGFLQAINLDPLASLFNHDAMLGRTVSSVGMPTTLALFLVITVPFVLLLGRLASPKAPSILKKACILLFLLNVFVLLSTISRSAILALSVAMLASLLWNRGHSTPFSRRQKLGTALACLALVGAGALFMEQRFSVPTEPGRSLSARGLMWESSLPLIAKYPLGAGLESTLLLSARYLDPQILRFEGPNAQIDRLHNQFIDLVITLGPLAALAYFAFIILLFKTLWQSRTKPLSDYYEIGFISLLGASITLLFNFHVFITALFFWFIVGLMLGAKISEKQPILQRGNTLIHYSCIAIALTCFVLSVQWSWARYTMDKAESHYLAGDITTSALVYAKASRRFPFDRQLLIRQTDTNLQRLERDPQADLKQQVESQITQLEHLTGYEDGMALLLRAWLAAIDGERNSVEWLLLQASMKQTGGLAHYRVAKRCFELLEDEAMVTEIQARIDDVVQN